jgi:hypothetical protein
VPVPSRRARRDITPREPVCCGRMAQMMWRGVWPPRAPPRHACRHPVLRRASGSHAAAADQQLDSVVRGHGHLQRGDRPAQPLQVVVPDRGRCVSILLDANGRYVGNLSQGGRQYGRNGRRTAPPTTTRRWRCRRKGAAAAPPCRGAGRARQPSGTDGHTPPHPHWPASQCH